MKHFDKIKLFSMVCFVVFSLFALSCKQDQRMPQLNTSKQSDSYDENAPKTTVGIDEVVKFNFSENEVRAISLDQTQATGNKGAYQRPQLKWVVGDKYRFYATLRYVDVSNERDWKPNFSNDGMWIEVTKVSSDGRSGEFRIRGEMKINTSYIKDATTKNPSLTPNPDNWYIGGFIGGKLDAAGKTIADNLGITPTYEGSGIKGIKIQSPKFVAVDPDAKTFDMNVPLGVPLSKVIIKDYGTKIHVHIPEGNPLQLKPLGTVFCVQVKNGLVHSVAIPKNSSSVKIKSRFLTEYPLQFDMWHYASELSKAGKSNYSIHYIYENDRTPQPDTWGRTEKSVPVDWSQYTKKQYNGDVVLDMDDCVNLYLWSVWDEIYKQGNNGYENYIELDFSGLNLKTPMYSKADRFNGFSPMNSAKVTYYGGVDATTRNEWRTMYPNKTVDFLSTNVNKSRTNINKESTVFSRFTIQSELIISEVYFDWNSENNGIIEIFNPNSTAVDLSDYYLMRMDYSDGTCMFVGPFGTRTDRLQCGLLMPLNLTNTIEFTPGTLNKNHIHYHKRDRWNDYGEMDDPTNPCLSAALLFAPHDQDVNTRITHLDKGITMCIAGHGVYNLVQQNPQNNREPEQNKGLYATGMIAKIKDILKSYIVTNFNITPKYLGYVWGVVDGEINKKINASANDMEAGVTARDANQGWALVKKIEGKYYIIDSFGPTWLTPPGGNGITAQGFRNLMNDNKTKYKNNFDMIRNDNIVFPNGGMVGPSMSDEWSEKADPAWEVSIGARSRYDRVTGRSNIIPYFFGGR